MQHIDRKYVLLLSTRLTGFKQKSANLYNCKCPLCGDSESNSKKKRGYFYLRDGSFQYYCHNKCGGMSLKNLFKQIDYNLYKEYSLESLLNNESHKDLHIATKTNIAMKFDHGPFMEKLKELKKVSQLPVSHPAKKYVMEREIPPEYHSIFRWAPKFMTWSNELKPKLFNKEALEYDEGRIVIPFFDKNNKFFAYTGRSISINDVRYILIILDNSTPCLFGMNNVNLTKKYYVVEGPIDSVFLHNCIALGGSKNIGTLTIDKNAVIIFDNEPHSKDTKAKISQAINHGFKVCIWPVWVLQKDINAMVVHNKWNHEYIESVIDSHTYSGFEAKIKLEEWSRR